MMTIEVDEPYGLKISASYFLLVLSVPHKARNYNNIVEAKVRTKAAGALE